MSPPPVIVEGLAASAEGKATAAGDSSGHADEALDPECMYSPDESFLAAAAAAGDAADVEAGGGLQDSAPVNRPDSHVSASCEPQTNVQAAAALVRGSQEEEPASSSLTVGQVSDAVDTPTSSPSPLQPHRATRDKSTLLELPAAPLNPNILPSNAEGCLPLPNAPEPLASGAAMSVRGVKTVGASKQEGIPSSEAPGVSCSAEGILSAKAPGTSPPAEGTLSSGTHETSSPADGISSSKAPGISPPAESISSCKAPGTSSAAEGIPSCTAPGTSSAAKGTSCDGASETSLAEGIPNTSSSRQVIPIAAAVGAGPAQGHLIQGPSGTAPEPAIASHTLVVLTDYPYPRVGLAKSKGHRAQMEDNYDVVPLAGLDGPGYVYAVSHGLQRCTFQRCIVVRYEH